MLKQSVYGNGQKINYSYDTLDRIKEKLYNNVVKVKFRYDESGNPLSYRDGFNFTWANGRQLVNVTKGTDNISYLYNADGLRTQKTVNGVTTDYYWLNGVLQAQKTGEEYIIFLYDENGSAYGMLLKNGTAETYYYYTFNVQGDIVGIIDSTGTQVVSYEYGIWGDNTVITGTLADTIGNKNPLRYRSYYFDAETGFYYLQSRYYDPEVYRFINADSAVGINSDINAYNLFVYCGNNPVNRYDTSGMSWKELISGVIHAENNFAITIGIDTAAIGAFFLNMYRDNKGVYHAYFNCWQQYFGYNDMYDFFFDLGTSCKSQKFQFAHNGTEYVIWVWKGDYINLGAGAEMGIYTGGNPHWIVDKSLAMSMYLELQYNGSTIITHNDYAWWITGFNPNYMNKNADCLTASFTIRFNDPGMYNAFRSTMPNGWKFGLMQGFGIANFKF